jgi:hypothetical protein
VNRNSAVSFSAACLLRANFLDGRDLVGAGLYDEVVLATPVEHVLFGLVDAGAHVEGAAGGQGSQLASRPGPGVRAWMYTSSEPSAL